jgi:hypothetical protein
MFDIFWLKPFKGDPNEPYLRQPLTPSKFEPYLRQTMQQYYKPEQFLLLPISLHKFPKFSRVTIYI